MKKTILTEQELNVLRAQGMISQQEVAFRDELGNLFAENVMTRAQRPLGGGSFQVEGADPNKKLLLDQVARKGNVIH
jgi:hypothetical protein